ncbi:MAG: protein kinase [Gemmatimonadales bacterium]
MPDLFKLLQSGLTNRYRLERELGRGGMATVFLAIDLRHERPVALKVLHPELASSLGPELFLREIRITARLDHPHILPVFDSGETDGFLWYTMPYVEGESLQDRLRREVRLPVEEAVRLTREVADALGYAHHHDVIHRDIKPANILLSEGHARVADFGLACAVEAAELDELTGTGLAVGTPEYMAPEQAAVGHVDERSDIYALGCVLYEMLVGERPYTGRTSQAVAVKRLSLPVPSVRVVRDLVPQALDQAITRALAKVPADRFATVAEFAHALAEVSPAVAPMAPTVGPPTGAERSSRPRRYFVAVSLLLILALVGGLILRQLRRQPAVAAADGEKRLAVLPFENLGDSGVKYFAGGIADGIRGRLASLPALRVIARGSSNQYRRTVDPQRIGRELGVDYLLTGTVQWAKSDSGSRVRVTTELIQTADATTRWQQAFDAPLTDVFQVQADIANRVAQSVGVVLSTDDRDRLAEPPTRDLVAFDLYLQGRSLREQRTPSALEQAILCFTRAIERDTGYAQAYAALADAYVLLPLYEASPPADVYPRATQAAQRALALDSLLGQPHAVLAAVHDSYEWDWQRAELEYLRAIALSPNNATAHQWYAEFLSAHERHTEAMAEMERAKVLDPRSLIIRSDIGDLLYRSRHFERAIAELRETIAMDSAFAYAHDLLAVASLLAGHREQAVAAMETAVRLAGRRAWLGDLIYVYAGTGRRQAAAAAMRELTALAERQYVSPYALAIGHVGLGNRDQAFVWLERAVDARVPEIADGLAVEPFLDPLRGDPRFNRMLAQVGFPTREARGRGQ